MRMRRANLVDCMGRVSLRGLTDLEHGLPVADGGLALLQTAVQRRQLLVVIRDGLGLRVQRGELLVLLGDLLGQLQLLADGRQLWVRVALALLQGSDLLLDGEATVLAPVAEGLWR